MGRRENREKMRSIRDFQLRRNPIIGQHGSQFCQKIGAEHFVLLHDERIVGICFLMLFDHDVEPFDLLQEVDDF